MARNADIFDPGAVPPGSDESEAARSDETDCWTAARRFYVEDGCTPALVAERLGLKERTVRKHASDGGWARDRAAYRVAARRLEDALAPDDPAEALIAEQKATRQLELLVAPSARAAQAYAAAEINEALARGAVLEVRQWQKVLAELARNAEAFDRALAGGADPNARARTAYYRQLFLRDDEPAPDD